MVVDTAQGNRSSATSFCKITSSGQIGHLGYRSYAEASDHRGDVRHDARIASRPTVLKSFPLGILILRVLKADIRPGYTGQLRAKVDRVHQCLAH